MNGVERNLIVNADDLGMCDGVNAGIVEAHLRGVVTSSTLMVRQAAAPAAARVVAEHPALGIGLHVDLGQWDYARGAWIPAYMRCDLEDPRAVRAECRAQLERFRSLLGRDPTHIDSHQHVHRNEPVTSAVAEVAAEIGVPVRGREIRYEGSFYGQTGTGEPFPEGIAPERLVELIDALPPGWTEIGCHPGIGVESGSSYAGERERELRTLCHPSVAAALLDAGVRLRSFAESA